MNQMNLASQMANVEQMPGPLVLSVTFDVDQTSDQLGWSIGPDVEPATGRDMGSLALTTGDTLALEIRGYGMMGNFSSYQVVDCVIVTRPQLVQIGPGIATLYSPPSPFVQGLGATYNLQLDFNTYAENNTGDGNACRQVLQVWKHALDVNQTPGRWDLSMILTVRIMRSESHISEVRVFSFDPECKVGDGTDPDAPGPDGSGG